MRVSVTVTAIPAGVVPVAAAQSPPNALAPEATPPALLFDAFPSDDPDARNRLDNLAIELQRAPEREGYLIFYGKGLSAPDDVQQAADDALNHLSGERGIDPDRLDAVFGGGRKVPTTELWIMPRGGSAEAYADCPRHTREVAALSCTSTAQRGLTYDFPRQVPGAITAAGGASSAD